MGLQKTDLFSVEPNKWQGDAKVLASSCGESPILHLLSEKDSMPSMDTGMKLV